MINYLRIIARPILWAGLLLALVSCSNNYVNRDVPLTHFSDSQFKNFTYSESYRVRGMPVYKIGKPYKIKGALYEPKIDYDYLEVGIASWYGPDFHNKKTANGEIFDQNSLSAAHRTLPLPSIVIVTNLENGRSVKVRVNDRGPFAKSRIIDVSKHAAEILDFTAQGTAPVRVQIVEAESRTLAKSLKGKDAILSENKTYGKLPGQGALALPTQVGADFSSIPEPDTQIALAETAQTDLTEADIEGANIEYDYKKKLFIQVGAFSDEKNIDRAVLKLSRLGYPVFVQDVEGKELKRVLLGPLATRDKDKIESLIAKTNEQGFDKAHIYLMP